MKNNTLFIYMITRQCQELQPSSWPIWHFSEKQSTQRRQRRQTRLLMIIIVFLHQILVLYRNFWRSIRLSKIDKELFKNKKLKPIKMEASRPQISRSQDTFMKHQYKPTFHQENLQTESSQNHNGWPLTSMAIDTPIGNQDSKQLTTTQLSIKMMIWKQIWKN